MGNPAGPIQSYAANAGVAPVDLRQLIIGAAALRPVPVSAHTYVRDWKTASKPVALKCDDGNVYVVKARQPASPVMHRAIANEQIVGRLGALIDAPIPRIVLIDVPADLIANQREMAHMAAGSAHGSMFSNDLTEREAISHTNVAANRERFARLAILFGWVVADDHQFFYSKSTPHLVHSVDHAWFFPGKHSWTVQSLGQAPPPQPDIRIVQACALTQDEIHAAIRQLLCVTPEALASAVSLPPDEWGLSVDERVALLEFLMRRRETLLAMLPAGQNDGEHP